MNLAERINADLKEAMKNKNELELSVLRLMRTASKNKEIEIMRPLSDEEVQVVIRTMIKQGKDALTDFTSAGRQDLIDRQTGEIAILERYLPPAMPTEELEAICKKVIADAGATSPSDVGKVMGSVMKVVDGRADGSSVRTIVQRLLSGNG
ncbi:MAG: GatB/YqeY domain-containing protein [Candidatus Portnoybacteria bacterium]|nr:GatB/YqeY domain-containing protein [Candidatus Portnoybacteria bacterium]MDD5438507.1 GatB/YqeY domain-containing protein [Patescibacteria group bacterium]